MEVQNLGVFKKINLEILMPSPANKILSCRTWISRVRNSMFDGEHWEGARLEILLKVILKFYMH